MEEFFTDEDLTGLLDVLNEMDEDISEMEADPEMEASTRRYEEYIQKHQKD
ncbi:MAG: hypothetical protein K6G62_07660 [Eubacterium sp.]|nr:hypothetical protein [Eubacterium sp.]